MSSPRFARSSLRSNRRNGSGSCLRTSSLTRDYAGGGLPRAQRGEQQLGGQAGADSLARAQAQLQQRLQAELVEDGGVREFAAALARDERALHGRLQANRE